MLTIATTTSILIFLFIQSFQYNNEVCTIPVLFLPTQIRDPPQDGLFIYGLYLWGTHFEKSTNLDLADTSPRSTNPSPLPIVHLTIRSSSAGLVSNTTTENKPPYVCYSPCYLTRSHRKQPSLFHVKVISNDTGATKWSLRNMFCTLRPF